MAQAIHNNITSKFHNLSYEQLADAIGNTDLALKAHEAECKALKEEFKAAASSQPPASTSPSRDRIKSPAGSTPPLKAFLGDAWRRFETASITTVIRVKASRRLAHAA